jgi:hypothetical protein
MTERASTPLTICLSDPQGRDEAVAQEGAQNSVKKGSILRPIDPGRACTRATRRSPWLTLLARCECLKRHGVGECEGELGADLQVQREVSQEVLEVGDCKVSLALIFSEPID